jgi:hypothetical protein
MTVVELETIKQDQYQSLVKQGLDLIKQADQANWKLGELAVQVDKQYGQDRLGQFADDIDIDKRFLMDCRTTWQRWPQKSGRPRFFSIARILNPHPQRHQIVAKNPDITAKEAHDRMRAYNQRLAEKEAKAAIGSEPESTAPPDDPAEVATRHLEKIISDGKAMANQAKRYLEAAVLEKKLMDALSDACCAWKELLDQAVASMEDKS